MISRSASCIFLGCAPRLSLKIGQPLDSAIIRAVTKPHSKTRDKQLVNIELVRLAKKRELDQALNMKEFAVLADVSYSIARDWFRLPGFPTIGGFIFWADFVAWRQSHSGLTGYLEQAKRDAAKPLGDPEERIHTRSSLARRHIQYSPRAIQILRQAGVDV